MNFEDDEWISAVAKSVDEACKLVDARYHNFFAVIDIIILSPSS